MVLNYWDEWFEFSTRWISSSDFWSKWILQSQTQGNEHCISNSIVDAQRLWNKRLRRSANGFSFANTMHCGQNATCRETVSQQALATTRTSRFHKRCLPIEQLTNCPHLVPMKQGMSGQKKTPALFARTRRGFLALSSEYY